MVLAPTLLLNAGSGAAIARPTFSRDFAGEKTLNNGTGPAITFTRGSNATYFDASGTLRLAPHNLLLHSESLENAVWSKELGATVSSNTTNDPNGSQTADTITFTTTNANRVEQQFGSAVNNETLTFSVWLKGSGTARILLDTTSGVGGATEINITLSSTWTRHTATVTYSSPTGNRRASIIWRTSNTATSVDAWGAQVVFGSIAGEYFATTSAAASMPRFDHDPATGASRGLLIEESRQNLLQRSEELENAYWSNIDATVSANAATSPAATLTADRVYPSTNSAASVIFRNVAASASAAYSASVFVKAAGKTFGYLQINFNQTGTPIRAFAFTLNLSNGSLGSQQDLVGATTGVTATATSVGSGWYRLSLSFTTVALTDGVSILVGPCDAANDRTVTASGTDGIFAWGAQLEAGAFPTSYIPTTSAAVTRSADSAVVTPISSFYNASEGTLFAEASRTHVAKVVSFLLMLKSDESPVVSFVGLESGVASPAQQRFQVSGGTGSALLGFANGVANTVYRMAGAYALNDFIGAQNGTLTSADTSGTAPATQDRMTIGMGATTAVPFYGGSQCHIRKIAYWPKRLTNTLLEQLTT